MGRIRMLDRDVGGKRDDESLTGAKDSDLEI